MSVNPTDQSSIPAPFSPPRDDEKHGVAALSPTEEKNAADVQHIETVRANPRDRGLSVDGKTSVDAHNNVGLAVLEQKHVIPTTGKRMPTSKWEYVTFCIFCESSALSH